MPTATRRPKRISELDDAALEELLTLLKGADSVELKLTVPAADQRSAVQSLGLDPLEAQIRQVYFFDTPDLSLNARGVVVRARRVQQKDDDSVVKLRPVAPDSLPAGLRASPNVSVEVDAMPGGYVCSATVKRALAAGPVKQVGAGERPIRKLFSKEQRAFFEAHAPEGVALDDLTTLGPINVFKLKFSPAELGRRVVAEMWFYPDNSRILELSTKCSAAEAFQVAAEARLFLSKRGVDLLGDQQTKTTTALRYFTRAAAAAV